MLVWAACTWVCPRRSWWMKGRWLLAVSADVVRQERRGAGRGGRRAGCAGGLGACGTAVYEQLTVVLAAGIAGGLMGMAFQRAVAAGAATREGKVMTVAGLAGLGVFGMAVQDMAGPTAYKM